MRDEDRFLYMIFEELQGETTVSRAFVNCSRNKKWVDGYVEKLENESPERLYVIQIYDLEKEQTVVKRKLSERAQLRRLFK